MLRVPGSFQVDFVSPRVQSRAAWNFMASPNRKEALQSPSRHLSLGQLHAELARVQEFCQELQVEIDARWRLEPKKEKGKGKSRAKAQSAVEDRALQVLATVQGREDLERILLEQQQRVCRAQGVQQQLAEELLRATGDAQQLSLGLPKLLEGRARELQRQREREEDLRMQNQQRQGKTEELQDRLNQLQHDAHDLQGKTASMRLQHQHSAKLALEAESEADKLQRQCVEVKRGTDEIQTTFLASRLELANHLRQEIPKWQSQVSQLEHVLAQQREKLKAGSNVSGSSNF